MVEAAIKDASIDKDSVGEHKLAPRDADEAIEEWN